MSKIDLLRLEILLNMIESFVNKIMGVSTDSNPESINQGKMRTNQLDWSALLSYKAGTLLQIGLMVLTLWGLNQLILQLESSSSPSWLVSAIGIAFFTLISIRSRIFSPLDNTRSRKTYSEVKRPDWAPAPIVFPVVWMAIAVLRVISTWLIWQQFQHNFLAIPLLIFVFHLAVGDTWNTIFTVESRLGAGVVAVIIGPWLSVGILTITYWYFSPLAGLIIAPSWLWLSVATALVISIWRLNGREPLYPIKMISETNS